MKRPPCPEGRVKAAVYARDDGRCRYCGVVTSWRKRNKPFSRTVDHVIPRSKGGRTNIINLVTACKECNDAKKHFSLAEIGWKMLPKPTHTPEEMDKWKLRWHPDTCINCLRGSRQHEIPPYHGGPRECRVADTMYYPIAKYISMRKTQRPIPVLPPCLLTLVNENNTLFS